jgi:hypothetical protein
MTKLAPAVAKDLAGRLSPADRLAHRRRDLALPFSRLEIDHMIRIDFGSP